MIDVNDERVLPVMEKMIDEKMKQVVKLLEEIRTIAEMREMSLNDFPNSSCDLYDAVRSNRINVSSWFKRKKR